MFFMTSMTVSPIFGIIFLMIVAGLVGYSVLTMNNS